MARNEGEVIIELGAEGGSLCLYGSRMERGWSFTMEVIDWSPVLIDQDRIQKKSRTVDSWDAALELLDRFPWPKLSLISIHPDFKQQVWVAVQERLGTTEPELIHWRKLLRATSTNEFPLLFKSKWPASGLAEAIASLDITALVAEYHGVREFAPQRALKGKAYFVRHTGSTPGGDMSNRREEHLARALCDPDSRWLWPDGGWVRPLDYQVPLKARQKDTGIGKIDLLGVTDAGRFVVVELKVDGKGGRRGDSPPAALMEALRYVAILQANQSIVASEAKANSDALVSDEALPAIMLLGTDTWWQSWLTLRVAGSWTAPFARLLDQIETQTGIPVRCMAITEGTLERPTERHIAPVDLIGSLFPDGSADAQ